MGVQETREALEDSIHEHGDTSTAIDCFEDDVRADERAKIGDLILRRAAIYENDPAGIIDRDPSLAEDLRIVGARVKKGLGI